MKGDSAAHFFVDIPDRFHAGARYRNRPLVDYPICRREKTHGAALIGRTGGNLRVRRAECERSFARGVRT